MLNEDRPSTKEFSEIQENMVASFLGWKRVTGSGSRPGHPGDVIGDEWLAECKTHTIPNRPLVFDFRVWEKIAAEAKSQFKQPVLIVDDGSQIVGTTWVMFVPSNISLFPTVSIVCKNDAAYTSSLQRLEENYEDSPYIWMVLKHGKDRFAIMPLEGFKEYLRRL